MASLPSLSSLWRESLAYAIGGGISRAVNLLLLPIYTGALAPDEYGVLATLQVLLALITPIATLGLGVSLGICYFERPDSHARARAIWTASGLALFAATAVGLLAFSLSDKVSQALFGTNQYEQATLLALLNVSTAAIVQPLTLGLQFRRAVLRYLIISGLGAFISAALGILLVVAFDRGVNGILEGQLVGQLGLLAIYALDARSYGRPVIDTRTLRELLWRGLPMVPSFFFVLTLQQGNQIVLKDLRGLSELGVYAPGYSLGSILGLVIAGFTTAWTPFFLSASARPDNAKHVLGRVLTYYTLGAGSLTLLLFAWSRPLVGLLVANSYEETYVVVGFAAIAYFLTGLFSIFLPPVYFAKRVPLVTSIQGASAVLSLAANWYLIHLTGLWGAAIGLAVAALLPCVFLYGWIRVFRQRYLQIPYNWKRVGYFWLLMVLVSAFVAIPLDISLLGQLGLSCTATAVILLATITFLNSAERRVVSEYVVWIVQRVRQPRNQDGVPKRANHDKLGG